MPASLDCRNGGPAQPNGNHVKKWTNGTAQHNEDTNARDMHATASSFLTKIPLSPGSISSQFASSSLHPILPLNSLHVRQTGSAGRGVFASFPLSAGTVVEISHVLLFPAKEYHEHGRHTQLDDYTYVWSKGSEGKKMALALGIGKWKRVFKQLLTF